MGLVLAHGSFGQSGIRLLKLLRKGDRHQLRDLSVSVSLQGDFESDFTTGERTIVLNGEAIAERVYALARDHLGEEIEPFAALLANHFVDHFEPVAEAVVEIEERPWSRVMVSGRPRDRAFSGSGSEQRTASATRSGTVVYVEAGFTDAPMLKTLDDPAGVLAGTLSVAWRYGWTDLSFGLQWQQVRQVVLETFADHAGRSVQHALHGMGLAALDQCPAVAEIRFDVRANTYQPADLSRFGMDGTADLLIPHDEPQAVIALTVRRDELP